MCVYVLYVYVYVCLYTQSSPDTSYPPCRSATGTGYSMSSPTIPRALHVRSASSAVVTKATATTRTSATKPRTGSRGSSRVSRKILGAV